MSLPEYDENEAITFMRRELPEEANKRYSDDDLVDILDAIWDYYDSVEATSLNDIPDDDDEGRRHSRRHLQNPVEKRPRGNKPARPYAYSKRRTRL